MEHLPVHLADEARVAGPVQYRWMYPFERYLGKLKKTVGNKARVEGSICNAYLDQEASTFCSNFDEHYFEEHVSTRHGNVPRNFDGVNIQDDHPDMILIFKQSGRPFGKVRQRYLTDIEYQAIRIYILLNCVEVEQYINVFVDQLRSARPLISISEIDAKLNSEFADWFATYARTNLNMFMRDFARGPLRAVNIYPACFVNGYKFYTTTYGSHKATVNSGVCIKGAHYTSDESDYYGRLVEVVEVNYPGLPIKKTLLFKCEWYDLTSAGTQVHPVYKMVSINHKRKYSGDDAFVLATQACQVFYCSYPSMNRANSDWLAVCKTQARAKVHVPSEDHVSSTISPLLQEDDSVTVTGTVIEEDDNDVLMDTGVLIDIEDDEEEDGNDEPIESSDEDDSSDDDV